MDGYELCIRFSGVPNAMRLCGPEDAVEPFRAYLEAKNRSEADVADLIERFEGLYPYLHVIAERTNRTFTDEKVVEAYWIGNELLDELTKADYVRIIELLAERGLPASFAKRLTRDLPAGLVPHHNAHVCYVGPGRTARTVSATLPTMDRCRVASARVLSIVDSRHLLVEQAPLEIERGRFVLGEAEPRTVVYDPLLLPAVKAGDTVATHWGTAVLVLVGEQERNLVRYDERVRDAIPEARID